MLTVLEVLTELAFISASLVKHLGYAGESAVLVN